MLIANRYEPTGAMAWGGMAEVHTCTDHHLQRKVVLKRVKKPKDYHRLLDELKALLKMRSVHVVELLDIVEYEYLGVIEKGLVLEFIEGQDLAEGSLSYSIEYLRYLWQIAAGIADIHASNIIHRDIKPGNIRKSSGDVLKIIDFGLSREFELDDTTKSIIGSFGYLAPELSGPGDKKITQAADVYAFGATAASLLVPVAQQQGTMSPNLMRTILSTADTELLEILASCVDSDPNKRPAISEVRDVLQRRLLRRKHRAWISVNDNLTEINDSARSGNIKAGSNSIKIDYDGQDFIVNAITGTVLMNNRAIPVGFKINNSCLLTFGTQATGRAFATFDVSNPEISA